MKDSYVEVRGYDANTLGTQKIMGKYNVKEI